MRADLFRWYKAWRKAHPAKPLTEVQDLVVSMFGSSNDQKCGLKGAETKGFLLYIVDKIQGLRGTLRMGAYWAAAGQALVDHQHTLDSSPAVLTHAQHEDR
eukprot:8513554-Alexandrium_andersonii.AAC.1